MENQLSEARPPQPDDSASDQQITGLGRFLMWLFLLVFLAFGLMLLADLIAAILR
jgi:NADH:ubiquinone oxidoreductase subunit 6 (subunit J)